MSFPSHPAARAEPIPAQAGIGLRFPHHARVARERPAAAWFEIHPENYMDAGAARDALEDIRATYPISFHAVSLSLGSADAPDRDHLARLARLADEVQPGMVSDHLSWSMVGGAAFADLLPLPYTEEALGIVSRNVALAQDALGRRILVENPSRYVQFAHDALREEEFLAELARRTGCGVLCDVNNVYVSASNLGFDPVSYLDALPAAIVGEIHLAGHAVRAAPGGALRIDDHGREVAPEVWTLYSQALDRFGPVPTLIEWDTNIPAFETLAGEAATAQSFLDAAHARSRDHADAA